MGFLDVIVVKGRHEGTVDFKTSLDQVDVGVVLFDGLLAVLGTRHTGGYSHGKYLVPLEVKDELENSKQAISQSIKFTLHLS